MCIIIIIIVIILLPIISILPILLILILILIPILLRILIRILFLPAVTPQSGGTISLLLLAPQTSPPPLPSHPLM